MANIDMSLDDFIKKNNVKVQISNPNKNKRTRGNIPSKPVQALGKKFDARQKLGSRPRIGDARDKIIINKKSGQGDARNKIVSKQVRQGKFDARSLIHRQRKTKPSPSVTKQSGVPLAGFAVTRTLSNPSAKSKSRIQMTNAGIMVTRPMSNTHVTLNSSSLQVTKRNQLYQEKPPLQMEKIQKDFVPIIQIRNDRFKQPTSQLLPRSNSKYYTDNKTQPHTYTNLSNPAKSFSTKRGYQDLDAPQFNLKSEEHPAYVPTIHIPNVRAERRPVSYSHQEAQSARAPPGAATLSQRVRTAPVPTKRKQPAPPPQQVKEISGPLRLGKGGGPGIDLRTHDNQEQTVYMKKAKYEVGSDIRSDQISDDSANLISPLQGYRVLVTNLFNGVTQDDIIELFGAVGPLKKAKLLKAGSAEVVYIIRKDAQSAVQKYHSRELDGQPMYVKMTTPVSAVVKNVNDPDPDITGEALRMYKKGTGIGPLPEAPIEIPTIHRALFKAGAPGPNKSVKFTVKI